MTDRCKSCRAPIAWALTPKGHRIPLDPEPVAVDAKGAVVLVEEDVPSTGQIHMAPRTWAYGLDDLVHRMASRLGITEQNADALVRSTYEARLSHFATCPQADRHRRRQHVNA